MKLSKIAVWCLALIALVVAAACNDSDTLTEPVVSCEVHAYLEPGETVRPNAWTPWLNLIVTNEGKENETVEMIVMKLKGQAMMSDVTMVTGTTAITPFISFVPVNPPGVTLPFGFISPITIMPGGAKVFQLRATLIDGSWISGFTVTVEEVRLKSGCTVHGLPFVYSVPMGPWVGIIEKG
ncbi:MAG: hypothetical protein V2A55_03700 [Candidatus Jorgensenbacteria bacterium]